jgi:hypothetical protein
MSDSKGWLSAQRGDSRRSLIPICCGNPERPLRKVLKNNVGTDRACPFAASVFGRSMSGGGHDAKP